jgi:hypothetical protein
VGGRQIAPPDTVVLHGKALLSCATPPGLPQTVAGGISLPSGRTSVAENCVHICRTMYAVTLTPPFLGTCSPDA